MHVPNTPTIDDQRSFWDIHWQNDGQYRNVINDWSLARFDHIMGFIRSLRLESPKILDFGCGSGFYTPLLAQFGEATGIDLSRHAIERARARAPHLKFIAGNVMEMPLPRNHYDVVVSQEVLAHCENQKRYIDRVAETLKPGGHLILSTDNKFVLDRLAAPEALPDSHIDHFLTIAELKQLLRPKFKLLRVRTRLPMGDGGILRIVNSHKLNRALESIFPPDWITAFKEELGLGMTVVVLARRR